CEATGFRGVLQVHGSLAVMLGRATLAQPGCRAESAERQPGCAGRLVWSLRSACRLTALPAAHEGRSFRALVLWERGERLGRIGVASDDARFRVPSSGSAETLPPPVPGLAEPHLRKR